MARFLSLVLLFLPFGASAQVLFVDTQPMGAQIRLDGVLRPEVTPARLTDLAPGPHTVSVGKDGHGTVTQPVTVSSEPAVVEVTLPVRSVVLSFPQAKEVRNPLYAVDAPGQQFRYPEATFRFEGGVDGPLLTPVFPDEGLLGVAGWGLLLLTSTAVASTALDVWHMDRGWVDHPSLVSVGLWATTLLELPWYFSLEARKARFLRQTAPWLEAQPEVPAQADQTFAQAEEALESGDLAQAEELFTRVVTQAPDSRLVPGAWFRLARIHAATGRRTLAVGEYRLVVEVLPQIAYYDRARQALVDLTEPGGPLAP